METRKSQMYDGGWEGGMGNFKARKHDSHPTSTTLFCDALFAACSAPLALVTPSDAVRPPATLSVLLHPGIALGEQRN
jgi:hypothetical protein